MITLADSQQYALEANPEVAAFNTPQNQAFLTDAYARGTSQFGRGLRSAGLQEDVGFLADNANDAYRRGDVALAQALETQMQDKAAQAQQWAPTTQNFTDINSVGSAVDWATGSLGQGLRSTLLPAAGSLVGAGAGALTGVVTKNPALGAKVGAGVGGFLGGYNMEANESIAGSMMDPQIRANKTMQEIKDAGRVKGVAAGALEAVVPAMMVGKAAGLAGRVAKGGRLGAIGRAAGQGAATEFGTEGAQDLTGQTAENYLKDQSLTNYDYTRALNAGMAGAVAGGGMGAMGGAGQVVASQLGAGTDKVNEIRKDPIGAVTDGIVDLGGKAGVAAAKATGYLSSKFENKFNEEAMQLKHLLGEHGDEASARGHANRIIQREDASESSRQDAASLISGQMNWQTYRDKRFIKDEEARRSSLDDDLANEITQRTGTGKQSRMSPTLTDDFGEQEGRDKSHDNVTNDMGDRVKGYLSVSKPGGKSVMPTSMRMDIEAGVLGDKAQRQKDIEGLADIWRKQGVDNSLIDASEKLSTSDRQSAIATLGWVARGFTDTDGNLFVPESFTKKYKGGSVEKLTKAVDLAVAQGLLDKAHAEKVFPQIADMAKKQWADQTNVIDTVFSAVMNKPLGPQWSKKDIESIIPDLKRLATEGKDSPAERKVWETLFGSMDAALPIKNFLYEHSDHQKYKSPLVAAEEGSDNQGGEDAGSDTLDYASKENAKASRLVGLMGAVEDDATPFDTRSPTHRKQAEGILGSTQLADHPATVGLVDHYTKDLEGDAKRDAQNDLLDAHGEDYLDPLQKSAINAHGTPVSEFINGLHHNTRTAILGKINKRFRYVTENAQAQDAQAADKIHNPESFAEDFDERGENSTIHKGSLFLETTGKTPFKTSAMRVLRHVWRANAKEQVTTSPGEGAHNLYQQLLQGLGALTASSDKFTGRIGFKTSVDGAIKWLDADATQLPKEFKLSKATMADALEAMEAARRGGDEKFDSEDPERIIIKYAETLDEKREVFASVKAAVEARIASAEQRARGKFNAKYKNWKNAKGQEVLQSRLTDARDRVLANMAKEFGLFVTKTDPETNKTYEKPLNVLFIIDKAMDSEKGTNYLYRRMRNADGSIGSIEGFKDGSDPGLIGGRTVGGVVSTHDGFVPTVDGVQIKNKFIRTGHTRMENTGGPNTRETVTSGRKHYREKSVDDYDVSVIEANDERDFEIAGYSSIRDSDPTSEIHRDERGAQKGFGDDAAFAAVEGSAKHDAKADEKVSQADRKRDPKAKEKALEEAKQWFVDILAKKGVPAFNAAAKKMTEQQIVVVRRAIKAAASQKSVASFESDYGLSAGDGANILGLVRKIADERGISYVRNDAAGDASESGQSDALGRPEGEGSVSAPDQPRAVPATKLDAEKAEKVRDSKRDSKPPKEPKIRSALADLKKFGGINPSEALDLTGDNALHANRRFPGLFKKGGLSADALREVLHEAGWISDSIEQARELVQSLYAGDTVIHPDDVDTYMSFAHEMKMFEQGELFSGKAKRNAMSTRVHEELGKEGLAATHDSPIRHEGKFDWRAHKGKGEGNASFGAGTYLSTANGVHKSYKNAFTAKMNGQTRTKAWVEKQLAGVKEELDKQKRMVNPNNWDSFMRNGYEFFKFSEDTEGDLGSFRETHVGWKNEQYPFGTYNTFAGALKGHYGDDIQMLERDVAALEEELKTAPETLPASPTYHVTVNAKPEELLDWDAPLSEQSDLVKKALKHAARGLLVPDYLTEGDLREIGDTDIVGDIYIALAKKLGSQAKASDYLQSLGIVGHVYNAAGGKEASFRNYVVYDDSRIETNYVSFNSQTPIEKRATDEEIAQAREELTEALGDTVKAQFTAKLGDISGEWLPGLTKNLIRVAINSDVVGTTRHEALHEFFDILAKHGGEKVQELLKKVATNPMIMRQLERLLAKHPAALEQIKSDPEEAVAFMYQFWRAGLLKLGPQAETFFQKVKQFFADVKAKITGQVRDEAHAEMLMAAFAKGAVKNKKDRGAVVKALNDLTIEHNNAAEQAGNFSKKYAKALQLVYTAEGMMELTKNKHVMKIARYLNQKAGASMVKGEGWEGSYMDAKVQANAKYQNKLSNILDHMDKADVELVREALATGTVPKIERIEKAVEAMKALNEEMMDYIDKRNISRLETDDKGRSSWKKMQRRKDFGMPQVWDVDVVAKEVDSFKADLLKHHPDKLEQIAREANAELAIYKKTLNKGSLGPAAKAAADKAEDDFLASGKISAPMTISEVTPEMVADAIVTRVLMSNGKVDIEESSSELGITPLAASVNRRALNWINPEAFDKYKQKDLLNIYSSYIAGMTKRGEYTVRFGHGGEVIRDEMDKAFLKEMGGDELVTSAEAAHPVVVKAWSKARDAAHEAGIEFDEPYPTIRIVGNGQHRAHVGEEQYLKDMLKAAQALEQSVKAIQAMEGTLGMDVSPAVRDLNSWLMTYQNVRLLPFSLFTSLSDVVGITLNGGTMKDAWDAFVRGMREVKMGVFNDTKSMDTAAVWAESIGAVDAISLNDTVGQGYGSMFMTGAARNISDKFFKKIGMESWNRAMRISAAHVAKRMIEGWAANKVDRTDEAGFASEKARFERLYGEGASAKGIKLNSDGSLDVNDPANQAAVMRFVNDAVLRPNAAMRPMWGSDPHYASFFHLKSFTYAMHKMWLEGALNEAKLGNYKPAMVLLSVYLPMGIAAGAAKEMLIPGDEPAWMQGGLDDYLSYGVSKAGLLGVPQMIGGAWDSGFTDLAGPSVSQVRKALVNYDNPLKTLAGALPGGGTLQRYVGE